MPIPNQSRPPAVEAAVYKRVLKYQQTPILTLTLRCPHLTGEGAGCRRINRFYERVSRLWRERWEGPLYQQAQAAAAADEAAGVPPRPWEARLDFTTTLLEGDLLSLYIDVYEFTGGAHGTTLRQGDTWQIPAGAPRTLSSFYPPRSRWRRQVLAQLHRQAARNIEGGETLYYEDWAQKLSACFDPDRFYLTPEGICLFYPLYTIAPYAEGIPVFQLPYPQGTSSSHSLPAAKAQ